MADDQTNAKPKSPRIGFRESRRAFLDLVEPGRRWAWGLTLALSFFAAIVEMLGAALVFAIVGMFATDVDPSNLPVVGGIVERVGAGDSNREILLVAAFAALFYVFRGAVVLGQTYYQARVIYETTRRISVRLFRGYLSLPYPFFLQRNSAELIRTAFTSVRQVQVNFLTPSVKLASDGMVAAGFLIVLVLAAPWATTLAREPVWPSDLLIASGEVREIGGEGPGRYARLDLQLARQSGEVVVTGEAEALVDPPGRHEGSAV